MNIKVNETPVRTSRNFKINNIKLENIEIPEKLSKFKNVTLVNEESIIKDSIERFNLEYGNLDILTENVRDNANSVLNITTTKKQDNIKIEYNFTDDETKLVNNIEINAKHDVTVVIVYKSKTEKECFHNGIIRLNALENVKVNIVIVNMLNNNSVNFEAIENTLESNSNVKYTLVELGGAYSISNYYSNICGYAAKNDLKTIYLGNGKQVKDLNYIVNLTGEKTGIDIDVQGVLKDESKKNFKGTIDFKKGCKGAKGDENEFCMLLSPKAKSLALPMLLCTESDVEGNHSTASGKVDNKSLFYIMSRGFSETEAIKLLVRARFNKIIERIKDDELKDIILQEIDNRLE